jgi:6-pyruvoyltetrahydropterin/6-carboxytetrahydropterin synthase
MNLNNNVESTFTSTKIIELGSCAFRQWRATHSHCSKIHGYQLKAKFWFSGSSLDDKNWIVDFGGLKDLKTKLQNQFDHTLCVAKDDPYLDKFQELNKVGVVDLRIMDAVGIEKTAEWCFQVAQHHIRAMTEQRCRVVRVEVFEHEDNSAIYEER